MYIIAINRRIGFCNGAFLNWPHYSSYLFSKAPKSLPLNLNVASVCNWGNQDERASLKAPTETQAEFTTGHLFLTASRQDSREE